MTTKPDDLEAVRTIAETLQPFDELERDRILRWVREKLGMLPPTVPATSLADAPVPAVLPPTPNQREAGEDISSFIANKAPVSDVHFAATACKRSRSNVPAPVFFLILKSPTFSKCGACRSSITVS